MLAAAASTFIEATMSPLRIHHAFGPMFLALLGGCAENAPSGALVAHETYQGSPAFTVGSGSTPTVLGRATFSDPSDDVFKVKRITGDWHVEIKAKPSFDLAVQSIVFQPGGHSGWHSHPGPVFIQVTAGTMTFYESGDPNCTPTVRTKGQAYLDHGDHAHIARNESGAPAQTVVTYFAPVGAPLRVDEPNPGNCPF